MFGFAKLTALFATAAMAQQCSIREQGMMKIGVKTPVDVAYYGDAPFSTTLSQTGATYAAAHFKSLDIPAGGKLTLTSLDGAKSVVYSAGAKAENIRADWAPGAGIKVTYEASSYAKRDAPIFAIDEVTYGKPTPPTEALCGPDRSKPAPCYLASEPTKTKSGKAVARLLIGGSGLCTGWLIGSEGHLMTNHHCIESAADAQDLQVELGAECKTCEDPNNQKQLACPGTIVATDATFIASDEVADFTLVKLNLKPNTDLKEWGYLQIRPDGPKLNETIHILGHAVGWPKRFAIVGQDGKEGTVTKLSIESCQPDEFGYRLDTQGGNSGSPVISNVDNSVVGLHNCGGCPSEDNGGIKINKVYDILKAKNLLPKDSVAGQKPAC